MFKKGSVEMIRHGLVFIGCTLLLTTLAIARVLEDGEESVTPETAVAGLTPSESADLQIKHANWLSSERPSAAKGSAVQLIVPPDQLRLIESPQETNAAPLLAGLVLPAPLTMTIHGLSSKLAMIGRNGEIARGALTRTRSGDVVWAAMIGSSGAGGIRLHLQDVSLPDNAELYFYSDSGESYGPFMGAGPDGSGDFWTPSIVGDAGILQLRLIAPVTENRLAGVSFRVSEVGHVSRRFFGLPPVSDDGQVASFCTYAAACVENFDCVDEPAAESAALAVAKMLWVQGPYLFTCTGALIADNNPGSQIPYFMTANHCLSSSNASLEAFFSYRVPCGTSDCPVSFDDPPNEWIAGKTLGGTIKATSATGDFSLFQLSQAPPAGSVFLGWSTTPLAFSEGATLHRVSHPLGAPQAYSHSAVSTSAPACGNWPRGKWIYSRIDAGATQSGSSGAPLVNASGQFVGQLTGTCGFNIDDACDHDTNVTADGALAAYFSSVAPFLTETNVCKVRGESCSSRSECCSRRCSFRGRCR